MKFLELGLVLSILSAGPAHAGVVQDSADMARSIFNQELKKEGGDTTASDKDGGKKLGGGQKSDTINPGAYTGKKSQSGGAAANAAAAAALLAACLAPCPKCAMPLCALSALAAMQAGHDSNAASQSAATARASDFEKKPNLETPTGKEGYKESLKKATDKMKAEGYQFSAAGLTTPDGKFIPSSSLSNAAALSAAGFDPSAVKETQKVLAAVQDEVSKAGSVSSVPVASGGGGGGSEAPAAAAAEPAAEEDKYINPFAIDADKKRQLMAGKTVNLDGEPIGVAGANIFEMVHGAYQKRRSGNQFIEAENAPMQPAAVHPSGTKGRAPANVNNR